MKNDPARTPRYPRSAAAALMLGLMGHGAFAQAPATAAAAPPATASGPASPSPATASAPASASPATASAPAQDIRDIRGPKPIRSPWLIPLLVLTGLLSGASIYATWTWYRRRARTVLRTPFDIALARLVGARALMLPELGRDFSIEVSSTAREYIESRFGVMAAHLTTAEFLRDSLTSSDPVLAAHRALLVDFLQSCDLAKFGGWNLSLPHMETMLQSARRFVIESAVEAGVSASIKGPATAKGPATTTVRPSETQSAAPRETYDSVPST